MRTQLSLLSLTLILSTGCFSSGGGDGDDGDTDQPASGGAPTSGGAPSVAAGGSDGGGGQPGDGGSASEDPEDPYCPHAWNGFEQLDIFIAETNAINNDPDMPGSTMNAHGEAAIEAAELTGQHFGRAEDFVIDTDASDAFEAILRYQEHYMVPHAELAATSSDYDAYGEASLALLLQDGVAEAVAEGAVASGTISAYTLERCGSNRWP